MYIHILFQFSLFSSILIYADSTQLFWGNISSDELLDIADEAIASLRIFIYPLPANVVLPTKDRIERTEEHFQIQYIFIEYLKKIFIEKDSYLHGDPLKYLVVDDPEQANVFFIEAYWFGIECPDSTERHRVPILNNVVDNYPYYNRSGGYDHFMFTVYDNGGLCDVGCSEAEVCNGRYSCVIQKIKGASFIGNYGMDYKFYSDPVQIDLPHSWDEICHRSDIDIVIPQLLERNRVYFIQDHSSPDLYTLPRKYVSCFHGRYHGQRKPLGQLVSNGSMHDTEYLDQCYFTYSPCGQACWSRRLFDSIASGCIPIIIADGGIQAFESFINYRAFTMKISLERFYNETTFKSFRHILESLVFGYKALLNHLTLRPRHHYHNASATRDTLSGHSDYNHNNNNNNHHNINREHYYNSVQRLEKHIIGRKRKNMQIVSEWLDFRDLNKPKHALKLIFLEMWCKITHRKLHSICKNKRDMTARQEYYGWNRIDD